MTLDEHILLETIFKTINDPIIVLDKEAKIVKLNDSALNFCNINSLEIIKGKHIEFLIDRCGRNCLEFINRTIQKKENIKFSHILQCSDNSNLGYTLHIQSAPLIDRKSNFLGVLLIIKGNKDLCEDNNIESFEGLCGIIGKSKEIKACYDIIQRLAKIDSNVLIIGETGTGKELIAEAIHKLSDRADRPLVKVNCSAITESLFESELFGSVKGAYTGAHKDKKGRIEQADGGTLFLDEIGDLPFNFQVKLLRFLQEKEFERVGEPKTIKADVRIIAATNKNLNDLVEEGRFRRDFYHRLNVFKITVPPLRSRNEDIDLIVQYFLSIYNKKFRRNIKYISEKVKKFFYSYYWPGNIRELKHLLEYAVIMTPGNIIMPESLPEDLQGYFRNKKQNTHKKNSYISEKDKIIEALIESKWHKSKASDILGISRRTLYRKLKKYNIS